MVKTVSVQASGQSFVDDLLNKTAWAENTITFGFTKSASQYPSSYGIGETAKGFQALSPAQIAAAKAAVALWGDVINLNLSETSGDSADIRIAMSGAPKTAWAYGPGTSGEAGDAWFGTSAGYYTSPQAGNYAFHTFIHELGHSLGLAHPHEHALTGFGSLGAEEVSDETLDALSNPEGALEAGTLGGTVDFGASTAANTIDAMAYSIMSYSSFANDGRTGYTNGTWDYAQTPMLRDVAAVQYLYGANYNTRAGDTVYSWNPTTGEEFVNGVGTGAPGGNKVFETLWDGGGRDTIDLSSYSSNLTVDLAPGGWANFGNSQIASLGAGHYAPGNVAFAYLYQGDTRSLIENAVGGSGNDIIKGNTGNNVLVGGGGSDHLEGVSGNNILAGGTINDELSLVGLNKADWISATLPTTVAAGDDTMIGGTGNDVFVASAGHDTVQGNGGLNTLIIDASLSAVTVTKAGNTLIFAYDGGTTTATGVDYLAVKDGIYAIGGSHAVIAPDASAGVNDDIALVYSAGLARAIDAPGLQYWSNMIDKGASLAYLASGIIASAEFASHFGNPAQMDDAAFVNVLYKNVLDRAGEAGGVSYWVDAMAHGESRADVLVAFSVSDENRAHMPNHMQADGAHLGDVDLVAVTTQQWASAAWA